LWEQSIDLESLNQIGQPLLQEDTIWFNAVTGDIPSQLSSAATKSSIDASSTRSRL